MKITYEKNGIRMKKLFGSREIPYSDIRSAVLANGEYTFTTKPGEVITVKYQLFEDRSALYEAIKKYNIYFKDEDDPEAYENVYSGEELDRKILQAQAMIKEYAGNRIRGKLGPEYDIDTVVLDEGELTNVYFRLLKSGELVKDIPDEAKYDFPDKEPYAFDSFVIAYLVEWDGCGKYGLTREMENRKMCEEYLDEPLKCLFENYKDKANEIQQEWQWCLVGNIVESHEHGEEHIIRYGTKQFRPNAKVYINLVYGGMGHENILVIGTPRNSSKYIEIVISRKYVHNFRVQKVFKPAVLEKMKRSDWDWWGDTEEAYNMLTECLEWLNAEE